MTVTKNNIDHVSGSKSENKRRVFGSMMEDAHKRKFDILLFWSLDRFTREGAMKTITYLQRLESYGIQFKSYIESYLDSTGIFKEAIISLLATLAKQERVRLSERVKAGLERKRKQGIIGGRPAIDGAHQIEIIKLKQQGFLIGKLQRHYLLHIVQLVNTYKKQKINLILK